MEKVACWSSKAAISLKRVKVEEKLLWRAYSNSPKLFQTDSRPTIPDPLRPPLLQDWGSHPPRYPPKTPSRGHLCDSSAFLFTAMLYAIRRRRARLCHSMSSITLHVRSTVCRSVCGVQVPYYIIPGTGEATDFKFGQNIHRVHPNNSPLKFLEKRERGRIQGMPTFLVLPVRPISG